MNIAIKISGQQLTAAIEEETIVAGSVGVWTFTVSFSSEWDGLGKVIIFQSLTGTAIEVPINAGGSYSVPYQILEEGAMYLSAYGTNGSTVVMTTQKMRNPLRIQASGTTGVSDASVYNPTIRDEIIGIVGAAKTYMEDSLQQNKDLDSSVKTNAENAEKSASEAKQYSDQAKETYTTFSSDAASVLIEIAKQKDAAVSVVQQQGDLQKQAINTEAAQDIQSMQTIYSSVETKATEVENNRQAVQTVKDSVDGTKNSFLSLVDTKTQEFNTNAADKTTGFDDHAAQKVTDFDTHATQKTSSFDDHVTQKETDFDAYAAAANVRIDNKVAAAETAAKNADESKKYSSIFEEEAKGYRDETVAARDSALLSKNNAEEFKNAAHSSETAAEAARDQAKSYADSIYTIQYAPTLSLLDTAIILETPTLAQL